MRAPIRERQEPALAATVRRLEAMLERFQGDNERLRRELRELQDAHWKQWLEAEALRARIATLEGRNQ